MLRHLAATLALLAGVGSLPAAGAQNGVPDHYAGLRIYVQGEILEVLEGGFALLVQQQNKMEMFTGADPFAGIDTRREDPMASDTGDGDARGPAVVRLYDAKGWVFIDDPEGGEQTKVRLDEARQLFRPGQVVQIGAAPGLPSSASHGSVSTQTTRRGQAPSGFGFRTPLVIGVTGWVYIRLNRFREVR